MFIVEGTGERGGEGILECVRAPALENRKIEEESGEEGCLVDGLGGVLRSVRVWVLLARVGPRFAPLVALHKFSVDSPTTQSSVCSTSCSPQVQRRFTNDTVGTRMGGFSWSQSYLIVSLRKHSASTARSNASCGGQGGPGGVNAERARHAALVGRTRPRRCSIAALGGNLQHA